ncbi:hypothetical protein EGW08_021042 [Elysia chlorotica]|uniref:Uncharacterized protein n=1 Tax=Elysia chlorotica TaxID=188477 RepID=A0A3S1H2Y9_ELYCH|nr:hypothetical protein EGW08_021042 [Elysia chlorotica]
MSVEKVSFVNIMREYANISQRLSSNSLANMNLDNVSIKIKRYTADAASSGLTDATEKEAVVDNGEAGPQLKTSGELENEVYVEIVRGYCEDFPHKEANFDLPGDLGKVKIHLNRGRQGVSPNPVEVAMSSSSGNGARATVKTHPPSFSSTSLTSVFPYLRLYVSGS